MRNLPFILSGLLLTACAELNISRSYLAEMEHDDTTYFQPGRDFPVTAGDSGDLYRSDQEQMARTPASEYDLAERRGQRSLREELRSLENAQAEHALNLYERHKEKLTTVSERIYFLKLSHAERKEYLETRGFLETAEFPKALTAFERMHAQRQSGIILGMSKEDVKDTWGKPSRVEIAGNPSYENERWLYNYNGATKYIYFEGGRVEGWE